MDSQITLVDPSFSHFNPAKTCANTVLRFDTDSAHNSTLTVENRKGQSYLVRSDRYATTTTVSRVDEDGTVAIVGVINRRSLLPDTISVGDEKMRLSRWLASSSFQSVLATVTINGWQYTWKTSAPNQIGMFVDSDDSPLAWFDRSHNHIVDGRVTQSLPCISVREKAEDILDSVVLACVVLDHRLRMARKAQQLSSIGLANAQSFAVAPGVAGKVAGWLYKTKTIYPNKLCHLSPSSTGIEFSRWYSSSEVSFSTGAWDTFRFVSRGHALKLDL